MPFTTITSHYLYITRMKANTCEHSLFAANTFCKCLCHYKCLSKLRMSLKITNVSQRYTFLSKLQMSLKPTNISQSPPSLQIPHVQKDTMKEPSSCVTNYISVCLSTWSLIANSHVVTNIFQLPLSLQTLHCKCLCLYGLALVSSIDKIIGLFCKRDL